jgi:AraC-like DNA-binding protein
MVEALKLPTSPMIMACADQILSCKYQEPMRGIYIRAKTAEIICDVVAALNLLSLRRTPHAAGPRRKASAIETAAEIYKREIDNPPTIEQLAFRVGLNRNELTTGFRDLFGATPHAYGHMLRMKQAQSLLLEGELSISEIARRVGYEGYSSFSRAYHSHYGRAPSLEADPAESVPSVLGTLPASA